MAGRNMGTEVERLQEGLNKVDGGGGKNNMKYKRKS